LKGEGRRGFGESDVSTNDIITIFLYVSEFAGSNNYLLQSTILN